MIKRIEIVPAGQASAVVETYLDGRRTAMSDRLPVPAARLRGETLAGPGGEVVDHTRERQDVDHGALIAVARRGRLAFR
jgi:hypothetical protein